MSHSPTIKGRGEDEGAEDREEINVLLRQKVWQGKIPAKISLAANESKSFTNSPPLFLQLPRILYLPCFLETLIGFFKGELIDTKNDEELYRNAWFSFEDAPLKWHWPIGVLFDLHTGSDPNSFDIGGKHPHLPWNLTVHFQDYPKDILTRRESPQSLKDLWLNNIKEVFSGSKRIFSLPTTQITSLYQSLLDLDAVTFTSLYQPLLNSSRHIPLRIFLPPPHPPITPVLSPMISSVEPQTVGTALHQSLPALFPSRRTCLFARPISHGIAIPLSAKLEELAEIFSGGDGWLDIIIVMMN